MVADAIVSKASTMRSLLESVRRDLVLVDVDNDDGLIALPSVYPGGAAVVVRVRRDGDLFLVSDQGNGFLAADLLAGARTYAAIAPTVAEEHGIKFDGNLMFSTEVSRKWLANAVIFTGAASLKAVERTADKMSEEREANFRSLLQDKAKEAFHGRASFNVEVRGGSTKPWKFPVLVTNDGRRTVFDIVSPNPNSIAAAFTKFRDVSDAVESVDTVAVASSKLTAADRVLISKAAGSVLGLDDPAEIFGKVA